MKRAVAEPAVAFDEVPLRRDGGLTVAVVADTHGQPHPNAKRLLGELRPDVILHAGDVGSQDVLEMLASVAGVLPVRGNIDPRELPDVRRVDVVGQNRQLALRILLTHVGVAGTRLRSEVASLARAQRASLVVCGHSHVPFAGRDRELTVFNPGSVGPRRFHLPIVFGVMTVDPTGVRFEHINCETGSAWRP